MTHLLKPVWHFRQNFMNTEWPLVNWASAAHDGSEWAPQLWLKLSAPAGGLLGGILCNSGAGTTRKLYLRMDFMLNPKLLLKRISITVLKICEWGRAELMWEPEHLSPYCLHTANSSHSKNECQAKNKLKGLLKNYDLKVKLRIWLYHSYYTSNSRWWSSCGPYQTHQRPLRALWNRLLLKN